MRGVMGVVGVLCFAVTPVLALPADYVFELDPLASHIGLDLGGIFDSSPLAGTFSVTIYQSDGHIGESDTFVVSPGVMDASIVNTEDLDIVPSPGLIELHVLAGDYQMLDFQQGPDTGHIGPGGVIAPGLQVWFDLTFNYILFGVPGSDTSVGWAPDGDLNDPNNLQIFDGTITTSVSASDTVTMQLSTQVFVDVGLPVPLIMDIVLEGTAHVVPDPAFVGLVALGMGGAGAWLRRRRA